MSGLGTSRRPPDGSSWITSPCLACYRTAFDSLGGGTVRRPSGRTRMGTSDGTRRPAAEPACGSASQRGTLPDALSWLQQPCGRYVCRSTPPGFPAFCQSLPVQATYQMAHRVCRTQLHLFHVSIFVKSCHMDSVSQGHAWASNPPGGTHMPEHHNGAFSNQGRPSAMSAERALTFGPCGAVVAALVKRELRTRTRASCAVEMDRWSKLARIAYDFTLSSVRRHLTPTGTIPTPSGWQSSPDLQERTNTKLEVARRVRVDGLSYSS